VIDPSHPPRSLPRAWPFKGTYYGWAIVAAGFAASFGEVPAFGPILGIFIHPIEEELGWTRATIAWGFLIGSVTGALASIVVGRFVDRYGSRVVVAIAGVLITGALLGLSTINEPWQFWLFFGIARGSAVAGVEIGTSVAIAKWFYRKRARTLGLKGVGQRTGQALAPFLILAVMSASDWRTSYVVLAGFSAILITNYFGRASLGSIRGFAAPFRAISPIGPVLAGFVRDETGSYSIAFIIFLGVATLMLLVMILATPPPLPRETVPDPQDAALGG
jgi:MFS family permease